MLDSDADARCWKRRAEHSSYCAEHADYPNFCLTVQRWVADRQQRGLALDETDFMSHARAVYPDAAYELPRFHDFQKFVSRFAD